MLQSRRPEPISLDDAILEVLERLWTTKLNSIALIERWASQTGDMEIGAGLSLQLEDERRHLRLIGEQIRRLGGRFPARGADHHLARPFQEAEASSSDVSRLFAFYRGIKAFTIDRCGHLIPMVDGTLAQTLEGIAREEERHIRWADSKIQRLLTYDKMRECNILLGHMKTSLELGWERTWRQVQRISDRRFPGSQAQ